MGNIVHGYILPFSPLSLSAPHEAIDKEEQHATHPWTAATCLARSLACHALQTPDDNTTTTTAAAAAAAATLQARLVVKAAGNGNTSGDGMEWIEGSLICLKCMHDLS